MYVFLFKSMVMINMDISQAENFLTSQSKKQDSGITDTQAKTFLKVWKTHRERIHQGLVDKCMWDNTLKSVNWRIDVKTKSRQEEIANVPTAIVEMAIGSRQATMKVRLLVLGLNPMLHSERYPVRNVVDNFRHGPSCGQKVFACKELSVVYFT